MVKYNKPALTFSQQVDLLIARGLVVNNKKTVETVYTKTTMIRLN